MWEKIFLVLFKGNLLSSELMVPPKNLFRTPTNREAPIPGRNSMINPIINMNL